MSRVRVTWGLSLTLDWVKIVLSLDQLGCRGDVMDDSAETRQSVLQEALVSSSGMGRDVHSLMLSIQLFFYWPQHHPLYKVPWRMVLDRLSECVTCPYHVSWQMPEEVPVDPQASLSCSSQQAGSMFHSHRLEEDGGDKRLVELELACKADDVAPPCSA